MGLAGWLCLCLPAHPMVDASSAVASSIQFNGGGGGHWYQYSCGISVRGGGCALYHQPRPFRQIPWKNTLHLLTDFGHMCISVEGCDAIRFPFPSHFVAVLEW